MLITMSGLITGLLVMAFKKSPPRVETIFKEAGVDLEAFYSDAGLFNEVAEYLKGINGQAYWAVSHFDQKLPKKLTTGAVDNGSETNEAG